MDRGNGGHLDGTGFLGVVPIQFSHIMVAQLEDKILQLERYDGRDAVLVGQHLQGGSVQMVVMVVGDDQKVDSGQLINRQSGRSVAFWSERWYRGGIVGQKWVYEDVPAAQSKQKRGVSQPGQTVSGACFEKLLGGHTMSKEVVGWNFGIVSAYLAPDVFDPGSQIVFVIWAAGRIAESVGCVVVGSAGQDLGFGHTGMAAVRTTNDQPTGEPFGRDCQPSPPGEPDELPPADRTVDDSMILSDSVLVHNPALALMVAEQEKNVKKLS